MKDYTRTEICTYLNTAFTGNIELTSYVKYKNYLFLRFKSGDLDFSIEKTNGYFILNEISEDKTKNLSDLLSLLFENMPKVKYDLVYKENDKTLKSYIWSDRPEEEITNYLLNKESDEYELKNIEYILIEEEQKKLH